MKKLYFFLNNSILRKLGSYMVANWYHFYIRSTESEKTDPLWLSDAPKATAVLKHNTTTIMMHANRERGSEIDKRAPMSVKDGNMVIDPVAPGRVPEVEALALYNEGASYQESIDAASVIEPLFQFPNDLIASEAINRLDNDILLKERIIYAMLNVYWNGAFIDALSSKYRDYILTAKPIVTPYPWPYSSVHVFSIAVALTKILKEKYDVDIDIDRFYDHIIRKYGTDYQVTPNALFMQHTASMMRYGMIYPVPDWRRAEMMKLLRYTWMDEDDFKKLGEIEINADLYNKIITLFNFISEMDSTHKVTTEDFSKHITAYKFNKRDLIELFKVCAVTSFVSLNVIDFGTIDIESDGDTFLITEI